MDKKLKSTDREQDKASVKNIQKWLRGLSSLADPHPSVQDIGERRRAQLLNIITLILTATFLLALLARPSTVGTFIFLISLTLASFVLGKTKYYKAGAGLFTLGFLSSAFLSLLMGTAGGFVTSITSTVPIALITASVLVGQREFLIIAIYAVLATFLAPYYSTTPTPDVTRTGGIILVTGAILYGINAFRANVERARLKEVQDVNRELAETQIGLEQRVADRTKALVTTSEVSRRLSTILEQKELVTEVVNQVKNAFSYYHTQIYFYDEANENLVMAGGTGEAGEKMLAQFHKVAKRRGLVGRAAESNQAVLVSDTSQDANWLPNPLLPDTKSEAAIPISIGEQVLGVLDVQHNVTDGLHQEDVDSLQSIANQVAVALQNIRQYENTRKIAADMGVVANVGIATSTITEAGHLLQEVVDLSKKSFNLYHAHIYLLNEAGDTLELSAGAGEVGRQMAAEKRSIPLASEQSLVARAARLQQGVVANDVTLDPNFLPNPLLPDTRSEMAVPMLVAGKTIGVLDVQSEIVNRFTEVDVSIQTTLASQIAVALQNARSFSHSQRQAGRETSVNLITQKIQSTTSIEAALQMAAREVGRALGTQASVWLEQGSGHEGNKDASEYN
jgi:GAF domain-containing protein